MSRIREQRQYRVYWRYIGAPRFEHEDIPATTALRAIHKLKRRLGLYHKEIDIYEVLVIG